jgi:hypothetical protein
MTAKNVAREIDKERSSGRLKRRDPMALIEKNGPDQGPFFC